MFFVVLRGGGEITAGDQRATMTEIWNNGHAVSFHFTGYVQTTEKPKDIKPSFLSWFIQSYFRAVDTIWWNSLL